MDSRDSVKQTIEEVEVLTGCPVQIVQDSSIKNMAVLDIARGSVRLHRIRIHPNFSEEADYLTCFQCGFILRKFAVPPEQRVDLMPAQRDSGMSKSWSPNITPTNRYLPRSPEVLPPNSSTV